MRRVFSQLFRNNYVTTSPTNELPKVRQIVKSHPVISSFPGGVGSSSSPRTSRSISFSSSPGSIPNTPTSTTTSIVPPPPIPVGPLMSTANYPLPYFTQQTSPQFETMPQEGVVERERRRRFHYSSLLNAAVDAILWGNKGHKTSRSALISELNVKQVLSKNEEMKKVILKVAAIALAQNEELLGGETTLHPFITTAGEVFFGANYNDLEDGQSSEYIQDILTPGLLVLLLETLVSQHKPSSPVISSKHILLAKALVETSVGYLLHRTVQETNHLVEDTPENSRNFERMHQGNKLATLTGDLLVVSLIKNVACTGNNKVFELVMNSLSEFSTTEITKTKPFEVTDDPTVYRALLPHTLAESIVFSKGFQSCLMLSGVDSAEALDWAAHLGTVTGLLWKTNFDWMKLTSQQKIIGNVGELNDYLWQLKLSADGLLSDHLVSRNDPVVAVIRELVHFWATNKLNNLS